MDRYKAKMVVTVSAVTMLVSGCGGIEGHAYWGPDECNFDGQLTAGCSYNPDSAAYDDCSGASDVAPTFTACALAVEMDDSRVGISGFFMTSKSQFDLVGPVTGVGSLTHLAEPQSAGAMIAKFEIERDLFEDLIDGTLDPIRIPLTSTSNGNPNFEDFNYVTPQAGVYVGDDGRIAFFDGYATLFASYYELESGEGSIAVPDGVESMKGRFDVSFDLSEMTGSSSVWDGGIDYYSENKLFLDADNSTTSGGGGGGDNFTCDIGYACAYYAGGSSSISSLKAQCGGTISSGNNCSGFSECCQHTNNGVTVKTYTDNPSSNSECIATSGTPC